MYLYRFAQTVFGLSQSDDPSARRSDAIRWLACCLIAVWILSSSVKPSFGQARGTFGKKHSALQFRERLDSSPTESSTGRERERINPAEIRPGDEIWFVNTHQMPEYDTQSERFVVDVYRPGICQSTGVDPLLAGINSADQRLNIVFVHGNRTDLEWAENRGWLVYRRVIAQCPQDVPVRFVIWAWPSQRQFVALRDFREKAERADVEGCHLGWFLQRIDPERQLGMIGYSFGARVVLGGIQRVATQGFCRADRLVTTESTIRPLLPNRPLSRISEKLLAESLSLWTSLPSPASLLAIPSPSDTRDSAKPISFPQYRVALVAAAFDRDWLLPWGRLGQSYTMLNELLLINNSADRAMRLYGIVDRGGFPQALGYQGIPRLQCLPDFGQKLEQMDVADEVGPKHSIDRYFNAPSVITRLHHMMLPHPASSRRMMDREGDLTTTPVVLQRD